MNYDSWELVLNFCENPCLYSLVCKTWKLILLEKRFHVLLNTMQRMSVRLNYFWCTSNPMFKPPKKRIGYTSPPLFSNNQFIL